MDGVLADGRKGQLWFCKRKDGHVLGLRTNAHGGERLLLFRRAVFASRLIDANVLTELSGTAHDIECDVCKAHRTWWNDKPALNILGSLYEKEKV